MNKQNVVTGTVGPPGLRVVQIAPVRVAFALPRKPSFGDPIPPKRVDLLPRSRQRRSDAAWPLVDSRHSGFIVARVVVPQGHKDIARVASDHDVLDLRME